MANYIKVFENVLPHSLCDKLVAKFERDSRVQPDPQPTYSTRDFIYTSDKRDWYPLINEITLIEKRLTFEYFESLGAMIYDWFDDGYVLAKYKKGDICALHNDNQTTEEPGNGLRYATLIFFLNDVAEGGETHFPMQDIKIKPKKGNAVMFPAMLTHPHEVLAPNSDRYIIQTWITDPEMVVNQRLDDEEN